MMPDDNFLSSYFCTSTLFSVWCNCVPCGKTCSKFKYWTDLSHLKWHTHLDRFKSFKVAYSYKNNIKQRFIWRQNCSIQDSKYIGKQFQFTNKQNGHWHKLYLEVQQFYVESASVLDICFASYCAISNKSASDKILLIFFTFSMIR